MNNVPFYEHKYLSWQNLDHCNGWNHDRIVNIQDSKLWDMGVDYYEMSVLWRRDERRFCS